MSDRPTLAQQQASNPAQSVWVSASAGTGKTRVLVNRVLRLLLTGTKPEKLLCITFTKAAAAEVLERIQQIVLQWSIMTEEKLYHELDIVLDRKPTRPEILRARRLLPVILQSPGGIKIMTIHAFCQSVLSRFPLEANISPGFSVIDEAQAQALLHQAKDILLQETTPKTNPELFDNLTRFFDRLDENNQNNLIQGVLGKRHRLYQFTEANNFEALKEKICSLIGLMPAQLSINIDQEFLAHTQIDQIRKIIPELMQGKGKTPLTRAEELAHWINHPNAQNYCAIYLTTAGTINAYLTRGIEQDWVIDFLNNEAQRVLAYQELKNKIDLAKDTIALLHVCMEIIKHYQTLKHLHSVLDYEDQILLTAELLKNPLDSQWVHYKLDGGIDHILVDEAQDTSPAQWDIITGITSDFFSGSSTRDPNERSLFVVGDEKQSIFSFQNADPVAFSNARNNFAQQAAIGDVAWEDIALIDNFRSAPLILKLTDQVFSNPQLAAYISHHNHDIRHQAFHATRPASVTLWPLVPMSKDAAYTSSSIFILADSIATQAQQLIGTIGSNGKKIRHGDIMILVRKRNPLVGPLTKAFKDRNIPVTSTDRLVLKDQLAVQDCLVAIQSCLHPYDDYALACFLKSPFIGLSEADLYALGINRTETLWQRFIDSQHRETIDYILKLSDMVSRTLPGHFIHNLLSLPCPADQRSGRHGLIKRLGYDSDDVLDEFLQVAYEFEENQNSGAQAFVTWMQSNQTVVKRGNSELDKSRVQIMTVHASKGLQAPIVILADANTKPEYYSSVKDVIWSDNVENGFLWGAGKAKDTPIFETEKQRYTELQFSEYYRLLYVAMTRAEEQLIICGWEKKPSHKEYPSWYDSITQSLQQLATHANYQSKEISRFGQSGLLLTQAGIAKPFTEDKTKAIGKTPIPDELLAMPPAEPKILRPLRPSRPPEEQPSVFSPLQPARKDPYKRGQILHTLFRLIPDYPVAEQEEALHNLLAHHIADPAEQSSMAKEVLNVLRDPTFAHLFTPAARAEVPIVGEVELDGQTYAMSGQIDRLLIEDDRVLIVDYKTNRPPVLDETKIPAAYRYQLRAYRALMQKIYPDKRIETALLWTSIPYLLSVSG